MHVSKLDDSTLRVKRDRLHSWCVNSWHQASDEGIETRALEKRVDKISAPSL
jgi:hypothetical protein